jgi:hypothetical protein
MKTFLFAAAALLSYGSIGSAAAIPSEPRVAKPVAIEGERPLTVRTDAGSLWAGSHVWSETNRVWSKPAGGRIEDLAIRPIPGGHEITFVQGGMTWRGEVDVDHRAKGPLQLVPSLDAGPSAPVDSGVANR